MSGETQHIARARHSLPNFLEELVEVEQDAVHAGYYLNAKCYSYSQREKTRKLINYEAVGTARKLVHFFDGDAVDFVVDVEAADVLAVACRECEQGGGVRR